MDIHKLENNYAEFTPSQKEVIKAAIFAGREHMKAMGEDNPIDFFSEFCRVGGIQVPGEDAPPEIIEHVKGYVMSALFNNTGARVSREDQFLHPIVAREINRAYQQANWVQAARHPDACGFHMEISSLLRNREWNPLGASVAEKLVECDSFGLGPGIYPKDEAVVLQPCCDLAHFEVVFKDEIHTA